MKNKILRAQLPVGSIKIIPFAQEENNNIIIVPAHYSWKCSVHCLMYCNCLSDVSMEVQVLQ